MYHHVTWNWDVAQVKKFSGRVLEKSFISMTAYFVTA